MPLDFEPTEVMAERRAIQGNVAKEFFINGYFCDVCSIGFVTRELLAEFGIDENWILNARVLVPGQEVRYAK